MSKKMLIDATHAEETRVVVVDGNKVEEFDFETLNKRQLAGNIYLAKVTRVEPSLQAAFVDYGGNRHGFLAFAEIHPDYYQIPVADRKALLDEERAYNRAQEDDDNRRARPAQRPQPESARAEGAVQSAPQIGGMDVVDLGDETGAYKTQSDYALEDLKSDATSEKYYESIKAEYEALQTKMATNKKDDLLRFKPEIKQFIEEEIVSRFEFQKGRVETSLKYDLDIAEAKKILTDSPKMKSILTTIDKPTKPFNPNKKF